MKFSLIIPAYNEEKRIERTLDKFSKFFDKKLDYEIIVIMDGCTDRTPEIVKNKAKKNKHIKYFIYPKKRGKGWALLKGFLISKGDYIAYTDADGSTPPEEIFKLLRLIGNYDGVIGSRWLKDSVLLKKQPFIRRIAGRGFNLLTRIILGLPYKDTQCPAKLFKSDTAKTVAKNLDVVNFAIDACILFMAKKYGYKIKEVPITWKDKPMSTLKIWKVIPSMFFTIIKIRVKN